MSTYDMIVQESKIEGIKEGKIKNRNEVLLNMHKEGFGIATIAKVLKVKETLVKKIIAECATNKK